MDHLWFHQIIFSSKILKPSSTAVSEEDEIAYSSTNSSQTPVISEEDSSVISNQDDEPDEQENHDGKERPTRLNILASKARSHSFSPSDVKSSGRRLQKTLSCKSLFELELEEVKGFMDLGFSFNKEHLNKRMMSVIPGLQRLELSQRTEGNTNNVDKDNYEIEDEDSEEIKQHSTSTKITRPYLSEAWLIKRPDSPLLNLRIPRVSNAADMKKHLKYWARTVASAILLDG
ncbi:hypothetical protein ACH5RR_005438 [Cinchona calisaya]|uniref:Uncharacterized protein n=1 Tax=Cinchona calisaya TaxID=153742 RepID=A0ABD3AL43_9GENT